MNAYLKLDHIDKYFDKGGSRAEVLKGINLTIGKGEFVSVIGHSGCGGDYQCQLVNYQTPYNALIAGNYVKCVERNWNVTLN